MNIMENHLISQPTIVYYLEKNLHVNKQYFATYFANQNYLTKLNKKSKIKKIF